MYLKIVVLCITFLFLSHMHIAATPYSPPDVSAPVSPNTFLHPTFHQSIKHGNKIAYLTFDDGPTDNSQQILDILDAKGAKATFFLVGPKMNVHPEIVKRMIKDGHYLGLHSMSHDAKTLYNGNAHNLIKEMRQTQQILYGISGFETNLIRVPYGSMPYLKKNYRDDIYASNYKMWDWTIDTYDWRDKNTPQVIIDRVDEQATEPVEIILMHDLRVTPEILPIIIDHLHAKGYELIPYSPDHHISVNFWEDYRL